MENLKNHFKKMMSEKQRQLKAHIQKLINDEDQAAKYFRYVQKLKDRKDELKINEMKKRMNMTTYKDFITTNIDE